MRICHIVALDDNHAIGKNNQLPWHLPLDLQYFKSLTQDSVIIMGKKTFQSIGRPLPNRHNIVLSTTMEDAKDMQICQNLDDALIHAHAYLHAKGDTNGTIWIIGGGQIFASTLAIADALYITQIATKIEGADTHYPTIGTDFICTQIGDWQHQNGFDFRFVVYQRRP